MNPELMILSQLEAAHPRLLKKSVLVAEVRLEADGVSATTVERRLEVLEGKGQVRIYEGEDVTRLGITAEGLNRLAEAR